MFSTVWQYVKDNPLEVIGFVLSLAGVWLTAKEKLINWPINIVASAVSAYYFYTLVLYGDAVLNIFFVVMCAYGWYEWMYGGKGHSELHISLTSLKIWGILLLITIPASIGFGILLTHTKSTVPYWDGITTAMSLAATWMAARKLIENWLVWIVADLIYVGMYIIKHAYLYSVLYFIFVLLAAYGYYAWRKQLTQKSFA